jgi:hypothetical protein
LAAVALAPFPRALLGLCARTEPPIEASNSAPTSQTQGLRYAAMPVNEVAAFSVGRLYVEGASLFRSSWRAGVGAGLAEAAALSCEECAARSREGCAARSRVGCAARSRWGCAARSRWGCASRSRWGCASRSREGGDAGVVLIAGVSGRRCSAMALAGRKAFAEGSALQPCREGAAHCFQGIAGQREGTNRTANIHEHHSASPPNDIPIRESGSGRQVMPPKSSGGGPWRSKRSAAALPIERSVPRARSYQ